MSTDNPLLNDAPNTNIDFGKIQKKDIAEAVSERITEAEKMMQQISDIEPNRRDFENTAATFDRMQGVYRRLESTIYLMAYVHPDEAIRTAAREAVDTLNQFDNRVNLDEGLYRAFKDYSESEEVHRLEGYAKKYMDDRMTFYRRNGFALPESERVRVKELSNKIAKLCLDFSSNINEYEDALIVTEDEISGLPEDYHGAHKQDDGTYKIGLKMPSYMPFMRYSRSDDARRRLMVKYLNRAPQNEKVLRDILTERNRLAVLLGYPSYAARQIEENMARSTETVLDFENSLREKIKNKAQKDFEELREIKRREHPRAESINSWENAYWTNKLLTDNYGVDREEVKQYFSAENVLRGLFDICAKLYDVRFEKTERASVWHSSVDMYQMTIHGQHAGFVYFDLYPRSGKYGHAACFTLAGGYEGNDGAYRYPSAALVCNFPPATSEKPALLPHGDVVTLFHEFGHLMHAMLAHAVLAGQSGISNVRDFVEIPSQMFENWAWDYDALSLFARHYRTGEILPRNLFDRMIAARNVGSGLQTQQQIFYGMLDLTYHNDFDADGGLSLTETLKRLQNEITAFPYAEGTHMYTGFDHLTGYAAGYYGYLWAKAYAEDIFSEFEKRGVLDKATGARFRDCILAKGSTAYESEMVVDFLQREPDREAFIRSLGI